MVAQKEAKLSPFRWLRRWIKGRLVQDVPEEIAACEFECRRTECKQGDWETCERRLRGMGGGKNRAE